MFLPAWFSASLFWEQSVQFEELLEVVTRAVAKMNIDWPLEEQEEHPKSKLD